MDCKSVANFLAQHFEGPIASVPREDVGKLEAVAHILGDEWCQMKAEHWVCSKSKEQCNNWALCKLGIDVLFVEPF